MNRTTDSTTHFHRAATLPDRQLDQIRNAYALAGIEPPTQTTAALQALRDEPTAEAVARQLATEAFHTNDSQQWVDDALEQIVRAQAADALRAALAVVGPTVRRSLAPGLVDQAAVDLAPTVEAAVKRLGDAAKKLDTVRPLSVDAAVRDDTTKQLKAAQAALAELGVFASIHKTDVPGRVHPALSKVLPIVHLPECVIELVADSFSDNPPVLNSDELAGSRAVRDLTRDLERDTDTALVNVARGKYDGVTLALADTATLRIRTGNAARSNRRQVAGVSKPKVGNSQPLSVA